MKTMNIKKLLENLKASYNSGWGDDLGKDFYSPMLSNCKEYNRMTGEFTSNVIFDWGKALLKVLNSDNNETIVKIIANPSLNAYDLDVLRQTLNLKDDQDLWDTISDKIYDEALNLVNEDLDQKEIRDLKLKIFSYLITKKKLVLKFGFPKHVPNANMLHIKQGIFIFENNMKVSFNGSGNETHGGYKLNVEKLDVFTNLNGEDPHLAICEKEFNDAWNGKAPGFLTKTLSQKTLDKIKINAPSSKLELNRIIKKVYEKQKSKLGDLLDEEQIEKLKKISSSPKNNFIEDKEDYLIVSEPKWEFQRKAREIFIEKKWGLLEMATGTGKTRTALSIATQLINENKINKIIIQMKGTDLIRQWRENIDIWTNSKISKSVQVLELSTDKNELTTFLHGYENPEVDLLLVRQSQLPLLLEKIDNKDQKKTLIIHDEVHDLFAEKIGKEVIGKQNNIGYKLGLSATIREQFNKDRERTLFQEIQGGGDQPIFQYDLIQAIKDGVLVESKLEVLTYKLYEDEKAKIRAAHTRYKTRLEEGWPKHEAEAERNIAISDVRKNARNKLEVFEENLDYLKDKLKRSFIFADETKYGKDILNILIPYIDVKTHFEDADKKNLENFSSNKIDCIINVLKLSQGIDIQNLNTIVLFATPTGRQFIQRIGRVLRKDKNNLDKKAIIIDFFDEDDLRLENEDSTDFRRYTQLKEITNTYYEPR